MFSPRLENMTNIKLVYSTKGNSDFPSERNRSHKLLKHPYHRVQALKLLTVKMR